MQDKQNSKPVDLNGSHQDEEFWKRFNRESCEINVQFVCDQQNARNEFKKRTDYFANEYSAQLLYYVSKGASITFMDTDGCHWAKVAFDGGVGAYHKDHFVNTGDLLVICPEFEDVRLDDAKGLLFSVLDNGEWRPWDGSY